MPAHDDAVLTGSTDGTINVWRRETAAGDRTRHVLERVLQEGGDGAVTAIAACPEARTVYVGSSDGLVTCWRWGLDDVDDGGEPRLAGVLVASHGTGAVLCLAVSGRVVVSGSADGTLCVWRRDDDDDDDDEHAGRHARVAVLAGHTGPVKCAVAADDDDDDCYDADGERRFVVYSGSLDGSVKVWRLAEERAGAAGGGRDNNDGSFHDGTTGIRGVDAPAMDAPVQQAWAPEMKGVAAA